MSHRLIVVSEKKIEKKEKKNMIISFALCLVLVFAHPAVGIRECLFSKPGCDDSSKEYCIEYECDNTCQSVNAFVNNMPTTLHLRCQWKTDEHDEFTATLYKEAGCTTQVTTATDKCTDSCRLNSQGAYYTCSGQSALTVSFAVVLIASMFSL